MPNSKSNVYIISAKRSALGSFRGSLSTVPIVDVASTVAKAALERARIPPDRIDQTIMGNILQAGLGQNPARQVSIKAGIPNTVPAFGVNMVCASSLKAIALAAQAIESGQADLILAGGLESMSRAPYLVPKARFGLRMGNGELVDSMIHDGLRDVFNDYHMGMTAENLVEKLQITRQEMDELALSSHRKASAAVEKGRFADEIVATEIREKKKARKFDCDECVRSNTSMEALSGLRPAFKESGSVTAGNSSSLSDGAAVVVLASEKAVREHNLTPMARIAGFAAAGVNPAEMGLGAARAMKNVLDRADMALDKVDLIEYNEAFASVVIAGQKELGFDVAKVNVNGGAIALGHPIGATGARLVVTLVHEMQRAKAKTGLATLCAGGGMGMAAMLELV